MKAFVLFIVLAALSFSAQAQTETNARGGFTLRDIPIFKESNPGFLTSYVAGIRTGVAVTYAIDAANIVTYASKEDRDLLIMGAFSCGNQISSDLLIALAEDHARQHPDDEGLLLAIFIRDFIMVTRCPDENVLAKAEELRTNTVSVKD